MLHGREGEGAHGRYVVSCESADRELEGGSRNWRRCRPGPGDDTPRLLQCSEQVSGGPPSWQVQDCPHVDGLAGQEPHECLSSCGRLYEQGRVHGRDLHCPSAVHPHVVGSLWKYHSRLARLRHLKEIEPRRLLRDNLEAQGRAHPKELVSSGHPPAARAPDVKPDHNRDRVWVSSGVNGGRINFEIRRWDSSGWDPVLRWVASAAKVTPAELAIGLRGGCTHHGTALCVACTIRIGRRVSAGMERQVPSPDHRHQHGTGCRHPDATREARPLWAMVR